jgi:hypothetical protein
VVYRRILMRSTSDHIFLNKILRNLFLLPLLKAIKKGCAIVIKWYNRRWRCFNEIHRFHGRYSKVKKTV